MMNYNIKVWWDSLTERERDLLITTLNEIDLSLIGIYLDIKRGYVKRQLEKQRDKIIRNYKSYSK